MTTSGSDYSDFVVLLILDGWGLAPEGPGNAITQSNLINFKKYWLSYPHTELGASGESVGLPRGEDGNTETGHLNLGAGNIVYQDLERVNMSIADGSFYTNQVFINAINHVSKNKSNLHIMGLIGAGGVHSNMEHLLALLNMTSKAKVQNLFLHLFTDGRDSPPTSAKTYIATIKKRLTDEGSNGKIASVMGRYWAMDRDLRWERTQKAYDALTQGVGNMVNTPEEAIDKSYSEGKTDEFIEPSLIVSKTGKPLTKISDNDAVIFFNFRIDRPRQLTSAFVSEKLIASVPSSHDVNEVHSTITVKDDFRKGKKLKNLFFATMTEYGKKLVEDGANAAFPPEVIDMPLGAVIGGHGYRQLRVAESEKERFVTYYFNGLRESPFPLEERIIVPSLKVPTYDQKPEMSAAEITRTLVEKISNSAGVYKLIVANYANPDMVAHTGNIGPTIKAIEFVDQCLGKVVNTALSLNGAVIITADHGNAEEMINLQTGSIDTEHSINNVPFIAASHKFIGKGVKLSSGILADIAPTILSLLGIPIPTSMTGKNLLAGFV
jgi:2,3-bisphosphoglycerate-independent phosphoglycerate mutase